MPGRTTGCPSSAKTMSLIWSDRHIRAVRAGMGSGNERLVNPESIPTDVITADEQECGYGNDLPTPVVLNPPRERTRRNAGVGSFPVSLMLFFEVLCRRCCARSSLWRKPSKHLNRGHRVDVLGEQTPEQGCHPSFLLNREGNIHAVIADVPSKINSRSALVQRAARDPRLLP